MRDSSSGDKLKIALFGDLSLEEAMDLSRDRQILEPYKLRRSHYTFLAYFPYFEEIKIGAVPAFSWSKWKTTKTLSG
jgi:hypothetical protein